VSLKFLRDGVFALGCLAVFVFATIYYLVLDFLDIPIPFSEAIVAAIVGALLAAVPTLVSQERSFKFSRTERDREISEKKSISANSLQLKVFLATGHVLRIRSHFREAIDKVNEDPTARPCLYATGSAVHYEKIELYPDEAAIAFELLPPAQKVNLVGFIEAYSDVVSHWRTYWKIRQEFLSGRKMSTDGRGLNIDESEREAVDLILKQLDSLLYRTESVAQEAYLSGSNVYVSLIAEMTKSPEITPLMLKADFPT
jgi:hypothetical protein